MNNGKISKLWPNFFLIKLVHLHILLQVSLMNKEAILTISKVFLLTWKTSLFWDTWTINMQSLLPYCHHWVACHFKTPPKYNPTHTSSSQSQETSTMNMQSLFLSVTDKWPFKDNLLSRTLLTWRALCPGKPEKWVHRLLPQCHHSLVCHFKTSSEYNSINLKSSVSQETWTAIPRPSFE